jgi:hypothetical protein
MAHIARAGGESLSGTESAAAIPLRSPHSRSAAGTQVLCQAGEREPVAYDDQHPPEPESPIWAQGSRSMEGTSVPRRELLFRGWGSRSAQVIPDCGLNARSEISASLVVAISLLDPRSPVGTPVPSVTVFPIGEAGCCVVVHIRATAQVVWTQVRPRRAMYWPMRTGPRHSGHQLLRRALRVLSARIIFPSSAGLRSRTRSRVLDAFAAPRALLIDPRRRASTCRPLRPRRLSCRLGESIKPTPPAPANEFSGGTRHLFFGRWPL